MRVNPFRANPGEPKPLPKFLLYIRYLIVVVLVLVTGLAANAQNPPPKFKPGAYRGTVSVTISMEGVAETTTTLKVKGRTQSDTFLRFMAVPQAAQTILNGDDCPLKCFDLQYYADDDEVTLWEFVNVDSFDGLYGRVVDTYSIKGNTVQAEVSYVRMIRGTIPVNYTIRVRLARVDN